MACVTDLADPHRDQWPSTATVLSCHAWVSEKLQGVRVSLDIVVSSCTHQLTVCAAKTTPPHITCAHTHTNTHTHTCSVHMQQLRSVAEGGEHLSKGGVSFGPEPTKAKLGLQVCGNV
eukprot:1159903-Pelagomonas_calceolata.AAC.1